MGAELFVDTDILYYANIESRDPRHALARACIAGLWADPGRAAVSVQVLQELHVNLMRKAGLGPKQSAERVSRYLAWDIIDNDRVLLSAAFDVQSRWQLSFWDSLIIAAAQRSGATTLSSEDFSPGRRYGEVLVENPLIRGVVHESGTETSL